MGKPISRSSGSMGAHGGRAKYPGNSGTLSIGGEVIANVTDIRIETNMGFVPPPPPARRAVAQSSEATSRNIWIAQAALEAARRMVPSPIAQTAETNKPPPSNDLSKTRKRKITLE